LIKASAAAGRVTQRKIFRSEDDREALCKRRKKRGKKTGAAEEVGQKIHDVQGGGNP